MRTEETWTSTGFPETHCDLDKKAPPATPGAGAVATSPEPEPEPGHASTNVFEPATNPMGNA